MKKGFFLLLMAFGLPMTAMCADGDTFTAETQEGAVVTYRVLSEDNKTCQVGGVFTPRYTMYVAISDYTGDVTIPSEVNGYTVTLIKGNAFGGASNTWAGVPPTPANLHIDHLYLPETISSIEGSAFGGGDIKHVNLPANANTHGEPIFSGCTTLESIELPDGITSLPERLFESCQCPAVESFVIPASVTSIGQSCFANSNLASIVIPATVQYVGPGAFSNCPLTSAEVLSPNTQLDMGVFSDTKLTSFEFVEGFTTTGGNTFMGCKELTTVVLPSTMETIGLRCFQNCYNLASINLPEGLTTIEDYGFYGTGFASIGLPSTLLTIGNDAFGNSKEYANPQLTSIIIPASVTYIGQRAFSGCDALKSVVLPPDLSVLQRGVFSHCENLETITLPDFLTSINRSAFEYCYALKNISFPAPLSVIEEAAFEYSGLTSVILPATLNSVEHFAFSYCKNLAHVEIQNPYMWMGDNVFSDNESITSFEFPEGMTHIARSVLGRCENLVSVTLPSTLVSIGQGAFSSCKALTSIQLPDELKSIDESAFGGSGLTSISLPKYLETIGSFAFQYCPLTMVTAMMEEPFEIKKNTFSDNTYETATLVVPEGSEGLYAVTPAWDKFYNLVTTGVNQIAASSQSPTVCYMLDGRKAVAGRHGMLIVKKADGSVVKTFTR